jgi:hypothetical protein
MILGRDLYSIDQNQTWIGASSDMETCQKLQRVVQVDETTCVYVFKSKRK